MKDSLTLKEIKDQYNRIMKTDAYLTEHESILSKIKYFNRIIYIGCGSSYSLAKSFAQMTIMHTNKTSYAFAAGDVMLRPDEYANLFDDSLIIPITRSGSTSEIIKVLNSIDRDTYYSIGFTCKENSPVGELCNRVFEMPWAFDESVCQTSCISNFYYVILRIINAINNKSTIKFDLENLSNCGNEFLTNYEGTFKEIAELPWKKVVTLGDSQIAGIVEEGALAFKEICQLASNSYNFLDVRHGPMVLIDKETLVIAPIKDGSQVEADLIKDIQKKGATIVTVSYHDLDLENIYSIKTKYDLPYPILGFPFINACQMISLYKAYNVNVDPDSPDGLDAWIKL